MDKMVAVI